MKKKSEEKKKPSHPWRENIEAMAMAIVVALLFKSFILEISKIPSGSMQPTLMGNPETEVFDRVLVDKLSYSMRDPERWEIVVFKHPLERSRIMVKRLVGMPGEELRIANGDLWTRTSSEAEWEPLRRPKEVQEEMWRRLDLKQPERSSWGPVKDTSGWHFSKRRIDASSSGKAIFRDGQGAIRDHYLDGYPDSLRGKIRLRPEWGRNHVGDLRLSGRVRAQADTSFVRFELSEGTRTYTFVLPGPAQSDPSAPEIRILGAQGVPSQEAAPWQLPAERWVEFAVQNLDDRLTLEIDGEELASLETDAHTGKGSGAALAIEGGSAEFEDLMVYRDIFYIAHRGSTWQTKIPEDMYVMLGDNTQDSADSRDWESVRFEWPLEHGEASVRGNFRGKNENPTRIDPPPWTRFRDEWGEEHWFPTEEGRQGLQASAPWVARHLIQGRALAVFWPIKPHRGLWRLSWLH